VNKYFELEDTMRLILVLMTLTVCLSSVSAFAEQPAAASITKVAIVTNPNLHRVPFLARDNNKVSPTDWQSEVAVGARADQVCQSFGFESAYKYSEENRFGKDVEVVESKNGNLNIKRVMSKNTLMTMRPFNVFTEVFCNIQ
jgi:hypothetical protein